MVTTAALLASWSEQGGGHSHRDDGSEDFAPSKADTRLIRSPHLQASAITLALSAGCEHTVGGFDVECGNAC